MKTRIAALTALLMTLVLAGCGEDTTSDAEPRGFVSTAQDTPADDEVASEPDVAALTAADEAYLAEVADRTWRVTVLDQFSDAELIAMGHEGCKQIDEGVKFEDLRLVEGEAEQTGAWRDTSAIFNSALLNYCPELMTIPG